MSEFTGVHTVIWDLDGTLLDSMGITFDVWSEVMPRHGRAVPTPEEIAKHYHGSLEDSVRGLVSDASEQEIAALLKDFLAVDNEYIQDADRHLFPDAVRLAERVHAAGLRQVLVSNRNHGIDRGNASPRNLIQNSRLRPYMDVVVCGDEKDFRKPDHRVLDDIVSKNERILTVGDQFVDAQFAHNLGGRAVLVCRDGDEPLHLERLGADWRSYVTIVRSLDEVAV